MLRILVLTLFMGSVAFAQKAKTLPGGAVLKPERPVPVRPLKPTPEPSPTATGANPDGGSSLPAQMSQLAPLVGNFSGALKSGAKVSVQCQAVAAETWLRCDVAVESSRPSTPPSAQGGLDKSAALVAVGWDDRAHRFNAFVGDSTGKSKLYKGRSSQSKLVFTGPSRVTVDLTNPQQPVFSSLGEVVTLVRDR